MGDYIHIDARRGDVINGNNNTTRGSVRHDDSEVIRLRAENEYLRKRIQDLELQIQLLTQL